MQELNMKKKNCQRFSIQAQQPADCIQKSLRIRCCGRVTGELESSSEHSENRQGQNKRMANGQGKRIANGQGKGMGNGQGKRMAAGQCQRKRMA